MRIPAAIDRTFADEDAREKFVGAFADCTKIREQLVAVLTAEVEKAVREAEAPGIAELPNPAIKYADLNAYRRGLRFAIDLLTDK